MTKIYARTINKEIISDLKWFDKSLCPHINREKDHYQNEGLLFTKELQ